MPYIIKVIGNESVIGELPTTRITVDIAADTDFLNSQAGYKLKEEMKYDIGDNILRFLEDKHCMGEHNVI